MNLDFSNKKKRFIPYFKSMNEVTVKDYKLMFLDGICNTYEEKKSLFIKSLRGEISN